MSLFAKKYFDYLTSNENFYMNNYFSKYRNENVWIALRRFPQGLFAIIITDEKFEQVDSMESINYLRTLGEPFSLNKIVLADNDYIYESNDGISKLIFNVQENKTIYCDEGCEALSKIALSLNAVRAKSKKSMFKNNTLTLALIGINIVVFIVSVILSRNIFDIDYRVLLIMGAKFGPFIEYGQYWRLITCMFLHGGLIHIFCNMYSLYYVGSQIEVLYGRKKYLLIYFISGIGSSLFSYIMSPFSISVGASGAIFGLLGAMFIYLVKERKRFVKGVIGNLVFVILINIYIGLSLNNIDNYAHIGGLIVGCILSFIFLMINDRRNKYTRDE